jgi:hypothetical protein
VVSSSSSSSSSKASILRSAVHTFMGQGGLHSQGFTDVPLRG